MMIAKDIIAAGQRCGHISPYRNVAGDMPVVNVLPRLLDTPDRRLGVKDGGELVGIIDSDSLLGGIGRMIAARDDCSLITLECAPVDYSASRIAHAVEDTDTHLVDLWSVPSDGGKMRVTLRVRRDDPSAVVHSLERYGYEVVSVYGNDYGDSEIAALRLLELKTLMNI